MAQPKHPLVNVVPRSEWNAIPPRGDIEPVTHPLEKVFITMDTASKPCYDKDTCLEVVADLQNRHITNDGAPDIRYNFLVGGDGNIYEGRGWHQKPQLSKEEKYFEDKSLDIAYIGTYEEDDEHLRTTVLADIVYSLMREVHPIKMYGWACDLLTYGIEKKYLKLGYFQTLDRADMLRIEEEKKLADEENAKQNQSKSQSKA